MPHALGLTSDRSAKSYVGYAEQREGESSNTGPRQRYFRDILVLRHAARLAVSNDRQPGDGSSDCDKRSANSIIMMFASCRTLTRSR